MAVVEELKQKLTGIAAQIQSKRDEIVVLEGQSQAFVAVIRVYEPGYEPTAAVTRRVASTESASGRAAVLLKGKNNRHIALDALRRLAKPSTSYDIARKFVEDEGFGEAAEGLAMALAAKFSSTLNGLAKQELIRNVGIDDSRRGLWQINR
jgi:hypothetical protein